MTVNTNNLTSAAVSSEACPQIPARIGDIRSADVSPPVVDAVCGEGQSAIRKSFTELGRRLAAIHRTAAEACLSQSLYEEAMPHLEAAATFSPAKNGDYMRLGLVQYLTNDDAGAINSFNHILSDDDGIGDVWYNLGMVVFGQGQYTEAEYCFRRVTELEATDAQTWNNRGVCLWRLGRIEEARSCFANALQLDASDEDARSNLHRIGS